MSALRKILRTTTLAAGLAAACAAPLAQGAATIVINNTNAAGVGFNDPTPAAPVGGNPGTTLGAQRLFAFTFAANIWGATLTSAVPIVINASLTPLSCTATGAVLGSAGATSIFRNFAGAPLTDTWYSYALANKLSGTYQGTLNAAQITANFNSNLGQANCLTGTFWYLGIDNNHGADIDFVTVLLHELGHGVGFQTFTNGNSGALQSGFPSVWDHFLLDTATGKTWKNSTNAERAASAISIDKLVWSGPGVTAAVPGVLSPVPTLTVSGSAAGAAAGVYTVGQASFGAVAGNPPVAGEIMPVVAQAGGTGPGCEPFNAVNTLAVRGNLALIDRGVCGFAVKVKNAQNAGAVGVIIANNTAGVAPAIGGTDPTVVIPAVSVSATDGIAIKAALATRSRSRSGVIGNIALDTTRLAGTDSLGRVLMYAPNPFSPGSSVSHFDVSAFRNLLMEPSISGDLTHSVIPPADLTFRLLQDTGW